MALNRHALCLVNRNFRKKLLRRTYHLILFVLLSHPDAHGQAGTPDLSFNPADSTVFLHLSIHSGTLPPGLLLADDGTISGTPLAAGYYPFVVRADNGSCSDTSHHSLRLDVVTRNLLIYPNPTSGVIQVRFGSASPPGQVHSKCPGYVGQGSFTGD